MLENTDFFKGGRVDQNALVGYIKAIKKNTKLSDEDAAVMAASKVIRLFKYLLAMLQVQMTYRVIVSS